MDYLTFLLELLIRTGAASPHWVAAGAGELVVVAAAEAPHRGALVVVAAANGLVAPAVVKWLGPQGKYIEKKIKKKNWLEDGWRDKEIKELIS